MGGSYPVTAAGGASGNPVTFSIDPASTARACLLSGAKVFFAGAGTCIIDANQAGNADYTAAPEVSQTPTVVPDRADLKITVAGPAQAADGASLTETVTVTNLGPANSQQGDHRAGRAPRADRHQP